MLVSHLLELEVRKRQKMNIRKEMTFWVMILEKCQYFQQQLFSPIEKKSLHVAAPKKKTTLKMLFFFFSTAKTTALTYFSSL